VTKGVGGVHISLNTLKLRLYYHNSDVKEVIENSDLCSADGVSIVFAGHLFGNKDIKRVPGIELFQFLLKESEKRDLGVFLLGSTDYVLGELEKQLQYELPNLIISGKQNGFWKPWEEKGIIAKVRDSGASICFIALPSPMKEIWIRENRHRFDGIYLIGVGGSFEVVSGIKTRAPAWMRKVGLEWFYRLLLEPRRLFKRYLIANLFYLRLLVTHLIFR